MADWAASALTAVIMLAPSDVLIPRKSQGPVLLYSSITLENSLYLKIRVFRLYAAFLLYADFR